MTSKNFKMWISVVVFSILLISVKGSGEFSILQYPSSIGFKGNDKLSTDNIPDVLLAPLGYYIEESSNWNGLYVYDPFNLPKAVVSVMIDGVTNIHLKQKVKSYPLVGDTAQESLSSISLMLRGINLQVIDIDLNEGFDFPTYSDILGDTLNLSPIQKSSTSSLKPDLHSEDKVFLKQLDIINTISDKIKTNEKFPILLIVRLSMEPLAETHGEKSPAFAEALKLISDAVEKLDAAIRKAYKGDALFTVISDKSETFRSKRQAAKDEIDPKKLNLATYYSDDYPVIFNIVLWFGVVMVFSLLAISYTIATMDPGRDSIIYRMTSTRMKKDN